MADLNGKRATSLGNIRSMNYPLATLFLLALGSTTAMACTGISLKSTDGAVITARTVEWALGDAAHDVVVAFPRTQSYTGLTPDGENGLRWTGKHGFVSLTAYGQDYGPDGMNEKGLYVGMYYFPGYASFELYSKSTADKSLSVGDFMRWLLSSFATVDEVKANLSKVKVVNVVDPRFGGAPLPFHWKIADPSGKCIVLEIVRNGEIKVYDALLGVISNSPEYDWHLTNLRNYLGLSVEPEKPIEASTINLSPFGSGSGLRGLPGDFTPPSRFVRAVAFTATARPLKTAEDAVFEAFRILDNFNIPVGITGAKDKIAQDIRSATQITTACDLKNRTFFFHTMDNRQIRKLDLAKIDFGKIKRTVLKDGAGRQQQVLELGIKPQ